MKPKIKNCRYIFGVLLLGILIWVGLLVKNHLEFQHEMVQIVHSKEVEKVRSNRMKLMMKRLNTIQWEGLCFVSSLMETKK